MPGWRCRLARVALGLWQAWRLRGRPPNTRNAARRLQGFANGALGGGLCWVAGIVFLWPPERPELQLFLMLLVGGRNLRGAAWVRGASAGLRALRRADRRRRDREASPT